jgi:RimJ/RimL family protein N-acetyltransferase
MSVVFRTDTHAVRTYEPADLQATFDVYRQCEDFLSLGPVPRASTEMVLADIRHSLARGGLFCVIENKAGSIVGVLDFVATSRSTAFLDLLMISRDHRDRGTGKSILFALERYLGQTHGVDRMESGVQTNNLAAIRFWKRCGFVIDEKPHALEDGTVAFEMSKEIHSSI